MEFISLPVAINGIANCISLPKTNDEKSYIEEITCSMAASELYRHLHNLPNQRPQWIDWKSSDKLLTEEEAAAEGMAILLHMSGWYEREAKQRLDNNIKYDIGIAAGVDPKTLHPSHVMGIGQYTQENLFRKIEIGFDRVELIKFLNVNGIAHNFGARNEADALTLPVTTRTQTAPAIWNSLPTLRVIDAAYRLAEMEPLGGLKGIRGAPPLVNNLLDFIKVRTGAVKRATMPGERATITQSEFQSLFAEFGTPAPTDTSATPAQTASQAAPAATPSAIQNNTPLIKLADLVPQWAAEDRKDTSTIAGRFGALFTDAGELPVDAVAVQRLPGATETRPPTAAEIARYFQRGETVYGDDYGTSFDLVKVNAVWLAGEFERQGCDVPAFLLRSVPTSTPTVPVSTPVSLKRQAAPAIEVTSHTAASILPTDAGAMPSKRKEALEGNNVRGAKRRILENWETIESLHPKGADGTQVMRFLKRSTDAPKVQLKTIQNHLSEFRLKGLIP